MLPEEKQETPNMALRPKKNSLEADYWIVSLSPVDRSKCLEQPYLDCSSWLEEGPFKRVSDYFRSYPCYTG